MLLLMINIITLAFIGYIDYASYKIPNVILCGWLWTFLYISLNGTTPFTSLIPTLLVSALVTGSFIPLSHVVKCSAGDFKLFGMLTATMGLEDTLWIVVITLSFSFFPFASGIKKVPLGFLTFFGYIVFLFFRKDGIL